MTTNIFLPLAANLFFDSSEFSYPKPLIEVGGKPIIQHVTDNLMSIPDPKKFIFAVNKSDDSRFHLSHTFRLLSNCPTEMVLIEGQTKGAACTALMAIDQIDSEEPLVISNADQVFNKDIGVLYKKLVDSGADAGVICFDSIHPRWSYIKTNDKDEIIEAAEKRPLSRNAIAGFYYFKKGSDFIEMAMSSIEKGAHVNGIYFIAPILNEFILAGKKLAYEKVDVSDYRTFYSIQKIEEALRDSSWA